MTRAIDHSKEKCAAEGCEKIRKYQPKTATRSAQSSRFCPLHLSRWNKSKTLEIPKKDPIPPGFVKNCIHHGLLTEKQVSRVSKYPRCKECNKQAVMKCYVKRHGTNPVPKESKDKRYTRRLNIIDPNRIAKNKDKSELELNFNEMNDVLIRFDYESIDEHN